MIYDIIWDKCSDSYSNHSNLDSNTIYTTIVITIKCTRKKWAYWNLLWDNILSEAEESAYFLNCIR